MASEIKELIDVINKYHATNPQKDRWLKFLESLQSKEDAIKTFGSVLARTKIAHSHEAGCDNDGMDTCPCGHTELWYAAKAIGVNL